MAPTALAFAVLDLTGSRSDLGFVLAARALPQVVFLLVGGVWADRLPRHHVLVGSSLLSGATQGTLAVLLLTGDARIWHLLVLSAANGTSSAFFFPASAGIVPQTVGPHLLQQANALLRLALNASFIGGAAVGGVVVAGAGSGWAVAVDALSFALGAVFIAAMRLPHGLRIEGSNALRELAEGWREFRSRTWLWAIVVQFSVLNAAVNGAFNVLGPPVARQHLGGAAAWGAILTCESAGLLIGGLLMLRLRPRRMLYVATLCMLLAALPSLLLGFPAPVAAVAAGALVMGAGLEVFGVLWDTSMQQEIPVDRLSRVYAYDALGSFALIPVAQAAAGPVSDAVGTRATLWGASALVVAATLPVLAVRDVRRLRRRD
jgi:MFS family permease